MVAPKPCQQPRADTPRETSKPALQRRSSRWLSTDNDCDYSAQYGRQTPQDNETGPGHPAALVPVLAERFHFDGGKRQSIASVGNEHSFLSPAGGHLCSTPQDAAGGQDDEQVVDVHIGIDHRVDLKRYSTHHSLSDEFLTGGDPFGRSLGAANFGGNHGDDLSLSAHQDVVIDTAKRPSLMVQTPPSTSPGGRRLRLTILTEKQIDGGSSGGSTGVPLLEPIREEECEVLDDDDIKEIVDVVPLNFDVDGGSSEPALPLPLADEHRDNNTDHSKNSVNADLMHDDVISEADRVDRDSKKFTRFDNCDILNVLPPSATSTIRSSIANRNDKTERQLSGDRHVSFSVGDVEDSAELTAVTAMSCTEFSALTPGSSSSASDSINKQVLIKFESTSSRANVVPMHDQRYPTSMYFKSSAGDESVDKRGDEKPTRSHDKLECDLDRSKKIHSPLRLGENLLDACVDSSSFVVDRWCHSKDRSTPSVIHKCKYYMYALV